MSINREELLDIIQTKRDIFLLKTSNTPVNTHKFKRLLGMLVAFCNKAPCDVFAFHIDKLDVENLDFDTIKSNLYQHILDSLQLNNHFIVNENFEILEQKTYYPSSSIEARETYCQASSEEGYTILLINKRYAVYYDGKETTNSTFAAEADIKKFDERKDLNQIFEVIDEFKEHIKDKYVYYKFFVDKVILQKLFADAYYTHRNLLRNKPENLLREELRRFLTSKIMRTFNFSRENQLDSNKRMDINVEDEEGNYYFFEIKWLGVSIHPDGDRKGTSFDQKDVLEGIEQTLKYIKELKALKKTVKFGCLVFFDARDVKNSLIYEWDKVEGQLLAYKVNFRIVDNLCLENTSPM